MHKFLSACVTGLLITASSGASSAAPGESGRPAAAFSGCDAVEAEFGRSRSSADAPAVRKIDPITKREFAASSSADIDSLGSDDARLCWSRVDGLWREDATIALDRNFEPVGWASHSSALRTLASGVYTTPNYLVVESAGDGSQDLLLSTSGNLDQAFRFRSEEAISLAEVLTDGGREKTYNAADNRAFANTLVIDVTRTGYARLRLDGVTFLRPRPGMSKSAWSEQISERDPFMIGFTMENIVANRRGYDLVYQNPDRFLENPKAEIFRRSNRGYSIDEKRIVPLGLRLIKEDVQGIVHYTSVISSERGFQRVNRSAFGSVTGASMSTDLGDLGLAIGSSYARESFSSLKSSSYVAEETGYMRYKKYALVLDHAYAHLSDGFIDAIDDAQKTGNYDAVIEKFGTHYPYAMTYGAAGKVSQHISKDGFFRAYGKSRQTQKTTQVSAILISRNETSSSGSQRGSSVAVENEHGEKVFTAVGGNGSWSEAGFASGDAHYPILADLRPIDELLSPIYFPGERDIYGEARRGLARAIESYFYRHLNLSQDHLLPDPSDYVVTEGCWGFTDQKGRRLRNMIEHAGENAITAKRSGAGQQGFKYIETEPNTYRAETGAATYFFTRGGVAIWRSNDSRKIVFRLRRAGERC